MEDVVCRIFGGYKLDGCFFIRSRISCNFHLLGGSSLGPLGVKNKVSKNCEGGGSN